MPWGCAVWRCRPAPPAAGTSRPATAGRTGLTLGTPAGRRRAGQLKEAAGWRAVGKRPAPGIRPATLSATPLRSLPHLPQSAPLAARPPLAMSPPPLSRRAPPFHPAERGLVGITTAARTGQRTPRHCACCMPPVPQPRRAHLYCRGLAQLLGAHDEVSLLGGLHHNPAHLAPPVGTAHAAWVNEHECERAEGRLQMWASQHELKPHPCGPRQLRQGACSIPTHPPPHPARTPGALPAGLPLPRPARPAPAAGCRRCPTAAARRWRAQTPGPPRPLRVMGGSVCVWVWVWGAGGQGGTQWAGACKRGLQATPRCGRPPLLRSPAQPSPGQRAVARGLPPHLCRT